MTEHEVYQQLEQCVREKRTWLLNPAQAAMLLEWARDITERTNDVVRENWRLAEAMRQQKENHG